MIDAVTIERDDQGIEAPIEVLFCANPDFYRHAAVAAVSLAENNRQSRINLRVLTFHHDPIAEDLLLKSVAGHAHLTLAFHYTSKSRFDRTFVHRHLTKETYMRFLAPEIYPPEVNRVLYLDCDIVVLDDLRPLWTMDLHGKAVAAAPELPWSESGELAQQAAFLGLDSTHRYVNCGILVLDLARWRRDRIPSRLFDFAEKHGSALLYHDQDTVNAVLRDDIHLLDCRWNLQARMYSFGWRWFPRGSSAMRRARRRPGILHYTTQDKPWQFRSRAARKKHYFRYLGKTAWRDARPDPLTVPQRVEWWLGRQLLRLGIDYARLIARASRVITLPSLWIRGRLVGARKPESPKLARIWRGLP